MGGGSSTQKSEPWDIQVPYLKKGFAGADQLLQSQLPNYYQGASVAGFDPAQQIAQQATLGYGMGPRAASMQYGAEGALDRQFGGYTGFSPMQHARLMQGAVDMGPTSPFASTAAGLANSVIGNLNQNILPGIRQGLVNYQPGGSSRGNLLQSQAINKAVASGLTKPMADMYSSAYNTAQGMRLPYAQMPLDQQQQGIQNYPSTMQAPLGMYDAIGGVGQQRRGLTQAGIDADMERYNYEAMAPYNALNQYMNTISGNYGGTTVQPSSGGGIGSMLGAVLPLFL